MRFKMAPRARLTLAHESATLKTIMMENAKHAKGSLLQTPISMYAKTPIPFLSHNSHDPHISLGGNLSIGPDVSDVWKRLIYFFSKRACF
jgi:hypothetical protein